MNDRDSRSAGGSRFQHWQSYWKGTLEGPGGKVTGRWGWRPWRQRSCLNLIFVENQSHQTPVEYSLNYRFFLNLRAFLTVKRRLPGKGAAVSLKPTIYLIWTCVRTQRWLCRLLSSGRNEHVCSPRTLGEHMLFKKPEDSNLLNLEKTQTFL